MNVLLTCAGRRNYLIEYFRDALAGRGRVYAADVSPDASTLQEAEGSFVVPPIDDPGYFDEIRSICRHHDIKLLLTLSDIELPLLARQRPLFEEIGTVAVVSSPEVVETCWDKWNAFQFLCSAGIPTAETYRSLDAVRRALALDEIRFPLVVKPRWGTASIAICTARDDAELTLAYEYTRMQIQDSALQAIHANDCAETILIQERLAGIEHGLDIVNDLEGRHVCTFARQKLAMRYGETDKATTVEDQRFNMLGRRIGERLGHIFMLDCDVFVDGKELRVLELNPRFGGGYPFSHVAGANVPAALLAWAESSPVDPAWLKCQPDVTSAKCDRLVIKAERGERADVNSV